MQVSANIKLRAPTYRGPSQQKVLCRVAEKDHRIAGQAMEGLGGSTRDSREHSIEHVVLAVAILLLLTGRCPGSPDNDARAGFFPYADVKLEDVDHITVLHLHERNLLEHLLLLFYSRW